MTGIGTLHETALHAALKALYAQPGDELEARVDGYVVDLLRGDLAIEFQTHHFYAIRTKLERLIERRPVRLVHPVAVERWIVRQTPAGEPLPGRRKSPRRGHAAELFTELVSVPSLLAHPNFSLELLLIREEEVRCPQAPRRRGRWRPKDWKVTGRTLLEVVDRRLLTCPADCLRFLPEGLTQPFTNRELAAALRQPVYVAEKMTYCLRKMGVLAEVGRIGRALALAVVAQVGGGTADA
jgi:hypothetical protein